MTTMMMILKTSKRKQAHSTSETSSNDAEIFTVFKKRRLAPESLLSSMKNRESEPINLELRKNSELNNTFPDEDEIFSEFALSHKKPLYGISHKITEKRNPITSDLVLSNDLYERGNQVNTSNIRMFTDLRKRDSSSNGMSSQTSDDSNISSLIQKMFFTLNTLNSNMTQLHSKVDLLSLEVNRIKKKVSPHEMVAEFHPPPEYQLTSTELKQVMDQSSSAGDLACRLLVQLFPELFGSNALPRSCSTCGFFSKTKLESLHLQLIRNYVEACYPSVKNNTVWQIDVLPHINDFFNRFWAEREMESTHSGMQTSSYFESVPSQNAHFVENKEQEDIGSLEKANPLVSENVINSQDLNEYLEEASSPGEFSVFLLHRLFPEIFNQKKSGDRYFGDLEGFTLDPHRLQLIRQYTEIYFPEVQEEEVWLQQCIHRINDELESMFIDGSECDDSRDDCFESNLPDDLTIVKVEDGADTEKPGRRSKKIWLVPFDFDKVDIPLPDFEVPFPQFLLSKEQIKNIYETSLSIGNFASRLLVHLFPELFTHENLRKQYNCSGSLGKKQLDPVRIKLIRHYVQILYPRAKNDRVWTLEFVGKLDERCRRRDTEQRRSYQQQRRVYVPMPERRDLASFDMNTERYRDLIEGPPLPPERSTKDFCKIPLDKIVVPPPDFPVPSVYLLSDKEIRDIVQQSLSVGNFAARLLVRLFPELFTHENLRLQYNHSGACNKKQLDPVRLRLIRQYVEAVYPVDKMEEVWHYECIPSIDERCRRPNRKKCDILKKATKKQMNNC
ncbi:BEN domain-containing protein 3 isoform X2 [Hyla sarda]|uniref:BEN domain-containing protein 3 isoform X2 n=1 Tax=Hyla sarda TaxID=327740 RepID=UPI0024C2B539|nr:BEN domain-containing protein 3 isoform X2 [Hyla sarda]XP_056422211.1 BEN domain-containing protein 3 isoform X2 [Hyla sarda]